MLNIIDSTYSSVADDCDGRAMVGGEGREGRRNGWLSPQGEAQAAATRQNSTSMFWQMMRPHRENPLETSGPLKTLVGDSSNLYIPLHGNPLLHISQILCGAVFAPVMQNVLSPLDWQEIGQSIHPAISIRSSLTSLID
jgi:hypothetical protein